MTTRYNFNAEVQRFQVRLVEMGFSLPVYGTDGKWGQETRTAMNAFQAAYGMAQTTFPTQQAVSVLNLQTSPSGIVIDYAALEHGINSSSYTTNTTEADKSTAKTMRGGSVLGKFVNETPAKKSGIPLWLWVILLLLGVGAFVIVIAYAAG
jgi:peptidoglycan hydrolase-like protein with peptidoglycan-binding domain